MSYLISAKIRNFNYYLRFDTSWAVPHRRFTFQGLKDNASKLHNKEKAEEVLQLVKAQIEWPLELITL